LTGTPAAQSRHQASGLVRRPSLVVIAGVAIVLAACSSANQLPTFTYAPVASAAETTSSQVASQSAPAQPSASAEPSPSTSPSASSGAAPSPSSLAPTVSLAEWTVVAPGTMHSGKADLMIVNNGAQAHELLIFRSNRDPAAYPTDAAGDIKEEGAGVSLVSDGDNIDPGGSQTRSVDLKPGKYLFVCNIPGHFKQGMYEVVIVLP
jgi:uncharacterized cupredoxin-like copper-binding protein